MSGIFWRGQFRHITPKSGSYYKYTRVYTVKLCAGLHQVEFFILIKNTHFINSEVEYLGVILHFTVNFLPFEVCNCNLTHKYSTSKYKKCIFLIRMKNCIRCNPAHNCTVYL